jgi:outer membrane protein assembly factor BamD
MNVALIRQYRGDTAEAIDALDRMINLYPDSLLAPDAYLTLAETFADLVQGPEYDQGATREAISYFEDFLILFSESQQAAIAENNLADMRDVFARSKLIIGEYYFTYRRWYRSAEIFLNEAITTAPDSPSAAQARERLLEIEARRAAAEEMDPEERSREDGFLRRLMRIFTR